MFEKNQSSVLAANDTVPELFSQYVLEQVWRPLTVRNESEVIIKVIGLCSDQLMLLQRVVQRDADLDFRNTVKSVLSSVVSVSHLADTSSIH